MILFIAGMIIGLVVGVVFSLWWFNRAMQRATIELITADTKRHPIDLDVRTSFEIMEKLAKSG